MMRKVSFNRIIDELHKRDLTLISNESEYMDLNSFVCFSDKDGYKYSLKAGNIPYITKLKLVGKYNIFSLYNINQYLKNNSVYFICESSEFVNAETKMKFVCKKCGGVVYETWHNINRKDNLNRQYLLCPNCGGRNESLHALVLKQIFLHEYPDTTVEDKSCVSPYTGKILPTDIVNHRLKIAIEIQSQWHDYEYQKTKDLYKKQYWIKKGYSFYDPDIRDYSVLQLCQLFFNINSLPDYINYEYSNKINIKEVQELLDSGLTVPNIEIKTGITRHRIYDALYSGKLSYPEKYRNGSCCPIVQIDVYGKFVKEFDSITHAEKYYNLVHGAISRALNDGRHFSNNSYWCYKDDYNPKVKLSSKSSKFYTPVNKYDKNDNYICSYNTIIDAAKENGVSNTQIYKVVTGVLKQTGGFVYKLC